MRGGCIFLRYDRPFLTQKKDLKMNDLVDDFGELGTYVPDESQLKNLERLVNQAGEISSVVDELEAMLKKKKEELQKLTHTAIPDAMAAAGTMSFTTNAGVTVSIKDYLNGSLPKEEPARSMALKWLQDNGGKDIIKSTLTAEFERGSGNLQKKNEAAEALSNLGVPFVDAESVHPQTLAAFARERMKNGEPIPLTELGLHAGKMAKIKK